MQEAQMDYMEKGPKVLRKGVYRSVAYNKARCSISIGEHEDKQGTLVRLMFHLPWQ